MSKLNIYQVLNSINITRDEIIRVLLPVLIILFFGLLWSLRLFSEWGSDYGFYYGTSYFLSDDYLIYKDAFTHKGPLYFIFIKCIGGIIGWGALQSYLTLVITALCFYFPIIYILHKRVGRGTNKFIVIFISIALLYGQNTNLSLQFFQSGILILSFYFLLESMRNTRWQTYVLSAVFFSLAIMVRIDAVVYSPAFMVALIFMYLAGIKVKKISQIAILGIVGLILPFLVFSYYLNFSLQDYLIHNIDYNLYYKKEDDWSHFTNRPVQFALLQTSAIGLVLFFLYLVARLVVGKIPFFSLKNNFNVDRYQFWLTILLIVLGSILWVKSNSGKDYHLFILLTPLVFFVSFFGGLKDISKKVFLFILPILLFVVSLSIKAGFQVPLNHPECINNYICQAADGYDLYIKPTNSMKNKEYTEIIGGRGWVYFFSSTKPKRPINDKSLYYTKIPFTTKALLNAHNILINQPSGYEFVIAKYLLNQNEHSQYLKQILTISSPVGDEGAYTKFKIK